MNIARGASTAVRKQVTVLFCDIANYTERVAQMDPEELAYEIRDYQNICARIAESYQGHVWSYLGDGIMVLFGYPQASEFAPERAVRAGLDMVKAIKVNNNGPGWKNKKPLTVRVGIATGLMVVGGPSKSYQEKEGIYGNASALADRLQTLAAPNTVVASAETRELVGLAFKFKDLGKVSLKGYQTPINAWQILSERKLQKRPGNTLMRATSRFISRKREQLLLRHSYESACHGSSRFVHIVGEPGIGKTRLIRNFDKSVASHDIHRMRVNCSPYYQNSFLKPISQECLRWLNINEDDDIESKQASVNWALQAAGITGVEQQILFSEFLDVPPPDGQPKLEMAPEEKRRKTIDIFIFVLVELSKFKPVLVVVEDLHWADPSTLELLGRLMKQARQERVIGILTSRTHFAPTWSDRDSLVTMELEGLTQAESKQLVESLFENQFLPESLKQILVRKSDGVPLFLEEACLSAIDHIRRSRNIAGASQGYHVPETLQDSLNARLDLLQDAKPLAQLASSFGESFSYPVISEIARLNHIEVDNSMDILLSENILVQQEDSARIMFRHAMFQEAAYQSLLIKTRQHYHQQIAELYQTRDVNIADKSPELIAYHLSKTKEYQQAIDLWIKAGRMAIEKAAIAESIDHLNQGLELITCLEPGPGRQSRELTLLLNLGVALTAGGGYYEFEVTQTYERAAELARQIGDNEQEWVALYGLWRCLISQAEYGKVIRMSARLTSLCRKLNQPILDLTATGIKALSRMVDGKLEKADKLSDQALVLYDDAQNRKFGLKFGQDPFVTIKGLGAVVKLMMGSVEDSLIGIEESVQTARATGHPYTIAETLKVASMYEHISRNTVKLRGYSVESIEIGERYGFEGVLATHRIFLASADLKENRDANQIAAIQNNLILYEQRYGLLFLPYFQGFLAEAYIFLEQYENAFGVASSIIEDIRNNGEYWVLPMILCMRCEAACWGNLAAPEEIKEWYLQALATAAKQKSRLVLSRILASHECFDIGPDMISRYRKIVSDSGDLDSQQ